MLDQLTLGDWRRRVAELYAQVRAAADRRAAWDLWVRARDEMFRSHPQSPLEPKARERFGGLSYFDYRPELRFSLAVEPLSPHSYDIATSDGTTMSFTRFGRVTFEVGETMQSLEVYLLGGYGGGLFLPLRDAAAGSETYGGGRYLLDTVKGADLGGTGNELEIDLNFAYNPSCSYDPRWVCPLAPAPNHLSIPIRAGERIPAVTGKPTEESPGDAPVRT